MMSSSHFYDIIIGVRDPMDQHSKPIIWYRWGWLEKYAAPCQNSLNHVSHVRFFGQRKTLQGVVYLIYTLLHVFNM